MIKNKWKSFENLSSDKTLLFNAVITFWKEVVREVYFLVVY